VSVEALAGLFERRRDARERCVQTGSEVCDSDDDRDGNAGGDESVLDRGGAGFVASKSSNDSCHE